MAAAFAAAMSFSACHNFDDYTTEYGPPADVEETMPPLVTEEVTENDISTTSTAPTVTESSEPAEETSESAGSSSGTTTGTASDTSDTTSVQEDTETTVAPATGFVSDDIELPTVYDPDRQRISVVYGPPSYES